jgi:aldose 1-epimerase
MQQILTRPHSLQTTQPQFLTATVLPNKGMHLLQITAYLPDQGIVELLSSPPLPKAIQLLADKKDIFGNTAFTFGSAILLPFANRIRGTLMPDAKTIETNIAGQKVLLPANYSASEKHAIHGLMYASPFTEIHSENTEQIAKLHGVLHAGDFNGHWLSKTDVAVKIQLTNTTLEIAITATNVGETLLPMSIGMHPYFAIPSGDRKQAKLHLPAEKRVLVNNYQDVFPTGELISVKGTPYDFTTPAGAPLGDLYLDDGFTAFKCNRDQTFTAALTDPITRYGLAIRTLSSTIKTMQIYAPTDKNFVAIEPQFNLSDPYHKKWGETFTGMVMLKPKQSTCWRIQLRLFMLNRCF